MGNVAKLMFVSDANNNKFYNMKEEGDTIHIEYGRVGATSTKLTKPSREWNKIYKEKTGKGYKDVTHLFTVEEPVDGEKPLNEEALQNAIDSKILDFINLLQNLAKDSVKRNYTISSAAVTAKQVKAAQDALNEILQMFDSMEDSQKVNKMLLELYSIIPRRMKEVKSFLLRPDYKKENFEDIIKREQDSLDVMAGQVTSNIVKSETGSEEPATNILERLGLELYNIDSTEKDLILSKMQDHKSKFNRGFKVINKKTQTAFDEHMKTVTNDYKELFWHGSRSENWWSIAQSGLLIRPSNAVYSGSMFGDSIYFASKFQKSLGYTSYKNSYWARGNADQAFLALYDVHLGKQMVLEHSNSSLNLKKVNDAGYDSVHGKAGKSLINDEFMIYKPSQCTIKYLIEIK